jgi:two-component system, sensor histidine kinase and response regulator
MTRATLLVVEDDLDLLSGIQAILELEDYHVLAAHDGMEALEIMQTALHPPDAIVADIAMPRLDGYELLEAVRREDAWVNIPFIFLTAKGDKVDRKRGTMLGADAYLTKPYDADELLVAIEARLRRTQDIVRVNVNHVSTLKRTILTMLNHEFRTPLTLIMAYADMLKDYDLVQAREEDLMTFLGGVSAGADRLGRLVENFIMMVDIESGDAAQVYALRRSAVRDLRIVIEDAATGALDALGSQRDLSIDVQPDIAPFLGYRPQLTIALRELVHNALKFSPAGAPVAISAAQHEDTLLIHVMDEGRGIPEREFGRITEPFYQIDRENREDQGAGVGLTIVDGIAAIHGGQLNIASVVGRGSRFSLILPFP